MLPPLIFKHKKRLESKLSSVNDNWDSLVKLLEWTTKPRSLYAQQNKERNQLIVWGETDRWNGLKYVRQFLIKNPQAVLIISGGVYGREKSIGDIGSINLFKKLEKDLLTRHYREEDIKSNVIIDSLSRHTGDQGKIIASLFKPLSPKEVFIVIPLYHMPRFLLSIGFNLKKQKIKPNIIPVAYGTWDSCHPQKRPLKRKKTYTYEELFVRPPSSSIFQDKFDCGEIDKIVQQVRNKNCLTFKEFINWFNIIS